MVVRLSDSYVSPELTLGLPEAVRECCCFQGLTRPFLGGPALLGAQQWLNLTRPRHFAAPETLWLTARTTPGADVDVVTLAARVSAFRGRKRAARGGEQAGPHRVPPQPLSSLQLEQVGKKPEAPSKPVTASSKLILSLGKRLKILFIF